MATVGQLPAERRLAIAAAVGDRLSLKSLFSLAGGLSLSESFPVWVIDTEAKPASRRLREMAQTTGTWHHQIRRANSVEFLARTIEEQPEYERDLLLARSAVAEKIDGAISWADVNIDDEWETRLLVIPRMLTHCFWFVRHEQDRIYVVDAPSSILREKEEITVDQLFAALESINDFEE